MVKEVGYYRWALDLEGFSDMVKTYREAHALTQKALGKMVGYSGQYIGHIEHGRWDSAQPTVALLVALCNLFDVDPRMYFVVEQSVQEQP